MNTKDLFHQKLLVMGKNTKVAESYIRRVLEVQEIYLLHKEPDLPDIYIYRRYIYPLFYISERTFRRYLQINAKKQVRQLESFQNDETTQTSNN